MPSGTMANQIALKLLTRPGDEVIVGQEAHMMWHEAGAGAANSGVQFTAIGRGGLFTAEDFRAACKPRGHIVLPPTGLVAIENTHNLGGGVVFPQTDAVEICAAARAAGVASYLDGARLFNASVASGMSLAELARPFDLVSVALVEGAGLPGRQRARRRQGADRPRGARAAHVRRRDAAIGHPRRRRALRARPQCRAARRRPCQCAGHRRAHRRAWRSPAQPRGGAEQHRHLGDRPPACRMPRRSPGAPGKRGCSSRRSARAPCAR